MDKNERCDEQIEVKLRQNSTDDIHHFLLAVFLPIGCPAVLVAHNTLYTNQQARTAWVVLGLSGGVLPHFLFTEHAAHADWHGLFLGDNIAVVH